MTPPNVPPLVVPAIGRVYPLPPAALITPPKIVIVDPSTFTPPNCVVDATAKLIDPPVLLIPLELTGCILTPPSVLVPAAGNE